MAQYSLNKIASGVKKYLNEVLEKLSERELSNINSAVEDLRKNKMNIFEWPYDLQEVLEIPSLKEKIRPLAYRRVEKMIPQKSLPEEMYDRDVRFSLWMPEWTIALSDEFIKSIKTVDKKIQGRILVAIGEICESPLTPKGDTIKPLSRKKAGLWRYRIGSYRLIYQPHTANRYIILLSFEPRGSVYQ